MGALTATHPDCRATIIALSYTLEGCGTWAAEGAVGVTVHGTYLVDCGLKRFEQRYYWGKQCAESKHAEYCNCMYNAIVA